MTILTKPTFFVKKSGILKVPLVSEKVQIEDENAEAVAKVPPYVPTPMWFHSMWMLLILSMVTIGGIVFMNQPARTDSRSYQGFCTISMDRDDSELVEPNFNMLPQPWTSGDSLVYPVPMDNGLNSSLVEEIMIGNNLEKITVFDNDNRASFIHDFTFNISGIVEDERCFLTELDPQSVLEPELFIINIETGGPFDTRRARTTLRAALPALATLRFLRNSLLANACQDRPTYRLEREDAIIVRKRSVELEKKPDYHIFSGNTVQSISISNRDQVLQYEKNAN